MASAVIGALRVNLGIDSAEFQDGLTRANAGMAQFAAAAKVTAAAIAAAFATGIGAAVKRVEQMDMASRKLDRALSNAGNAAKTSAREVAEWADKLERRTGRAVEEVMAVGANLASFNFGEEVFFRAIELADDMSAAWGGDLRNNLEGLSRALDDPIAGFAMLRKRGVSLTDAQDAMVKSLIAANDKLGAQKVVLEALEGQVKGVAEAGYQGMTKALGNAGAALDGFFDKIVETLGVGNAFAAALDRVTAAIDWLADNLNMVAGAAAIAGTGLAVAFAPALTASIWAAATALTTGVLAALTAIKVALLANPFTAFVLAVTAAIGAAYAFRDEIQKAIGVDVVGIAKDAANLVIGSFVAAYKDIEFLWGNFPDIIEAAAIGSVNAIIRGVNSMIEAVKAGVNTAIEYVNKIPGVNITRIQEGGGGLPEFANDAADRLKAAVAKRNTDLQAYLSFDYLGSVGTTFEASTPAVQNFAAALNDVGDAAGEASGKTKAALDAIKAEGERLKEAMQTPLERYIAQFERYSELLKAGAIDQETFNRAVAAAGEAFDQAEKAGKKTENVFLSIGQTIAQSIGSAFQGLIDGSRKVSDVLRDLLSQLASMAMNRAFQGLLGAVFGGGFGAADGFRNMIGYASGTNNARRGYAWVGENGPEIVKFSGGEQVVPNHQIGSWSGGGAQMVNINVNIDGANGDQHVISLVQQGVSQGLESYDSALPERIGQINANPRLR